jgi:hypothetical protein
VVAVVLLVGLLLEDGLDIFWIVGHCFFSFFWVPWWVFDDYYRSPSLFGFVVLQLEGLVRSLFLILKYRGPYIGTLVR